LAEALTPNKRKYIRNRELKAAAESENLGHD
jgi:hypothetical protein